MTKSAKPTRTPARTRRPGTKQAEKSANTRNTILQATVDCIVETGFARTSTENVAKRAGVSRGAMMHHFPNKQALLAATVEYVLFQRMQVFERNIRRYRDLNDRLTRGLDVYWSLLHSSWFVAQRELAMAARTDDDLAAILKSAMRDFEVRKVRRERELFPEWGEEIELHEFIIDLLEVVLEGVAQVELTRGGRFKQEKFKAYLKARMNDIVVAAREGNPDTAVGKALRTSREMLRSDMLQ